MTEFVSLEVDIPVEIEQRLQDFLPDVRRNAGRYHGGHTRGVSQRSDARRKLMKGNPPGSRYRLIPFILLLAVFALWLQQKRIRSNRQR